jgi:hypothetical protein
MALTQVTGPYPIFTDLDGTPLDDGYLYIGAINQDPEQNPIQVFWDSNLTIPATQPIRTSNGYAYRNGTPALLYTGGEFSITIRNKREEFVLYSPVGYGFDPAAVSASVVKNDFVGNGVQVAFVLSASPSTILATNIFINGVYQEKDSYTLAGNTITFSVAPPLSSSIEIMTNETGVINTGNATAISYTLTATGATAQTVQTKLDQYVSVKDFGAVGNGVTDDTVAIQAAIDALSPLGGTLYFPRGSYLVSDANADNACLVVTAPIQFLGAGAFYTSIQPAASVGSTVNTILVNPNASFDQTLMSFKNLSLGNLNNGTRQGNHGIYCLTLNAGQNLPKFTVENCSIQQGGGFAIYHLNDNVDNINGGMYAAYINNNTLKGGIKLENSGDSIVISNNVMSGTGTGVDAALITGASLLSILDNNITTNISSIIIRSGMRVNILRNNMEHLAVGSNSNAVIDIVASSGTYVAGVIQQNLVSAFGATDATKLIHIREARGTLIQDNTFLAGISGITAVYVDTTCSDIRIGANSYNATVSTKINDLGAGTMGVVKTPTLQNSWVVNSAGLTPTFYKDLSGVVHINGAIKDGTAVFGTTLFTLPTGFRPAADVYSSSFANNGTNNVPGYIGIDNAGAVYFGQGGNTILTTQANFVAANAANSVSPE